MKLVIVGGVAGGASAAARARRLSEDCEIVMFERGADPSFANCGMPYYVGGKIDGRQKLLVTSRERLKSRYRVDVRTHSRVERIDREKKVVHVHDTRRDRQYEEPYDKLILATGASPLRPPLEGIDLPGIHTLRDLRDADQLHTAATRGAKSAVIVGAGFIGMEMAENLQRRGLEVTVVELTDQILPPWDREMTTDVARYARSQGIRLHLGDAAARFRQSDGQLFVELRSGDVLKAGFVVLCIGVKPESQLAVEAGIECGVRGGVRTNAAMQTSDLDIYAVGDVAEVSDVVSGQPTQVPLAGPANRQGRLAADHIFGRAVGYRGTQGTAIVGIFERTVAMTGLSEKLLLRLGIPCQKIYIHAGHHAGYYPGAERLTLKLLFSPEDGKILGAQASGGAGVDKRIDVLAMAIQAGMTVYDLEEAELCYAPQFGAAKDPVNMAGFVAAGVLRGDQPVIHVPELETLTSTGAVLLDVRTLDEFEAGYIPSARHVPLDDLRTRLGELPAGERIIPYCQVGQRGYMATRILLQQGFEAANLSGGFTTWRQFHDA